MENKYYYVHLSFDIDKSLANDFYKLLTSKQDAKTNEYYNLVRNAKKGYETSIIEHKHGVDELVVKRKDFDIPIICEYKEDKTYIDVISGINYNSDIKPYIGVCGTVGVPIKQVSKLLHSLDESDIANYREKMATFDNLALQSYNKKIQTEELLKQKENQMIDYITRFRSKKI